MINDTDHIASVKLVHNFINNFIPLSEKEFTRIEKFWMIRSFPKRYRIIDIGETEDYFNIIIKGFARKFAVSEKKEVTRQLAMEGDLIFSEVSFVTRAPSNVIIETIEPSVFISIKHALVEQLYQDFPKMEKLGRLIITDMFVKKDRRDFASLNTTTRERFLNYIKLYPHILQRVPQKYIASYLNIKPETFSRLKHLLQKKPQS